MSDSPDYIIGAEQYLTDGLQQRCPTCHGTGSVKVESKYNLMDIYCPARLTLHDGSTIGCLKEGFHLGEPHGEVLTTEPCKKCWGLEQHLDSCPNIEVDLNSYRTIELEFDNDGFYWVKEVLQ